MKKLSFILLAIAILAGCSTKSMKHRALYAPEFNHKQSYGINGSTEQTFEQNTEKKLRKVVYNAYLKIVVTTPDTTNIHLSEIAKKYEGYVQVLGNKTSIIRVKSNKLQNAIIDITLLGKLKSKTISGDDVTDQYSDHQIRLDNAYSARKRYLELLAKAENVEAALKVEKELERLNGEIDALEGKLKRLEHLSEYSTITVYMEEKIKPGILGYVTIGVYKSVKWLFVRN